MIDKELHQDTVCAVIVTYNGSNVISNTVEALKNQVTHMVIVDNGSNEATVNVLKNLQCDKISVMYNQDNTGVAHALNQGVKYAISHEYQWVLTMDQDSIAESDMVSGLLDCAHKYQNMGKVVSLSPAIEFAAGNPSPRKDKDEQRHTVITSGNLIDIKVFEVVGYFEERLFIDSVDFDFCLRLLSSGYRIVRCHAARLHHSLGEPVSHSLSGMHITSWNHSAIRKYYMTRNNVYILKKYLYRFPLFCLRKQAGMVNLLLHTLFFESDRLTKLKYMLKGLVDGVWGKYGRLREN
jgi:rhamnosyltransferase